jgi:hypothetical protein
MDFEEQYDKLKRADKLDTGCWILDVTGKTENCLLSVQYWKFGGRLLATGCWILVSENWLLIIQYWIFVRFCQLPLSAWFPFNIHHSLINIQHSSSLVNGHQENLKIARPYEPVGRSY